MTETHATTNDASSSTDAPDFHTCAVPSCANSIPPSERPCKWHECSIGQPRCDCLPAVPAPLFDFPTELADRARWIKLIQREELLVNGQAVPSAKKHVCCRHFPDAKPTEAYPDPVLNLSQKLKDDDGEDAASTSLRMNNTNGSSEAACQDESDVNLIVDVSEPSTTAEITMGGSDMSAPVPPDESKTNFTLRMNNMNGSSEPACKDESDVNFIVDFCEPSSTAEITMESSDMSTPVPPDESKTNFMLRMNNINGSSEPACKDESDVNFIVDVCEPSSTAEIRMESSDMSTPVPADESKTNFTLRMNNTNGSSEPACKDESDVNFIIDVCEPSSTAEIRMESSDMSTPAPPDESKTDLSVSDPETPSCTAAKTDNSPSVTPALPERKGKTLKGDVAETSQSTSRKKKRTSSKPAPIEPVVRRRRSTPRKNYSEYRKESITSSESESSDSGSDGDSGADSRVYCTCGAPNTDAMVGCDGPNCENEWFHFKCVGIKPKKVPRGKWFCESCQVKAPKLNALKSICSKTLDEKWSAKLQQVCREIMARSITIQSASQVYGFSMEALSKHLFSKPILSTQEENRLVEMAVNMCKRGHWPMVQQSVVNSVKVLLDVEEKMGIKRIHPFTENLPARHWWEAFLQRHPHIQQLGEECMTTKQTCNSGDQRSTDKSERNRKVGSVQRTFSNLCRTDALNAKRRNKTALQIKRKHKKNILKKRSLESLDANSKKESLDANSKKRQVTADVPEDKMNALQCLEAIIVKKQRHIFQKRFKSGDESDTDIVYSAWRALRCLYRDSVENKQDESNHCGVPPYKGNIPPWSPCLKGPFYVPDASSKTSLSLLVGDPGKKRTKRVQSRIASMRVKMRKHYLEPWRYSLDNRKAIKPLKFEVKKRSKRKCFVTRRFDSNH